MIAVRAALRRHRGVLLALLTCPVAVGVAWLAIPPGPRAAWDEELGRHIAFGADDQEVITDSRLGARIIDARSGRVRAVLSGKESPRLVDSATTPDRRTLVSTLGLGLDNERLHPGILKVWDLPSGRERASFRVKELNWSDQPYHLSRDGKTLAYRIGPREWPTQTKVWDVSTGTERGTYPGGYPLAISWDGRLLIVSDPATIQDPPEKVSTVRVWDLASGRVRKEFRPPDLDGFGPADFSPDGRLLASAIGWEVTVREWATGRKLGTYGPALLARFTPHSTLPIGRDVAQGKPNRYRDYSTSPPTDTPIPGASLCVSTDYRCEAISASDGNPWSEIKGASGVAYDFILIDLPSGRERVAIRLSTDETLFQKGCFSPDGRTIAVLVDRFPVSPAREWLRRQIPGIPERLGMGHPYHAIRLFDTATGRARCEVTLPFIDWSESDFAFSPEGTSLAVKYALNARGLAGPAPVDGRRVEVWDLPPRRATGRVLGSAALWIAVALALGRWHDVRRSRRAAS